MVRHPRAAAASVVAALAIAAAALPASSAEGAAGDWRAARWGMTVDEVVQAFPGEARRLEPALALADGNVVGAGIDAHRIGRHALRVRFVFGGGKLVLVSLRTPPDRYAGPEVFEELKGTMTRELGAPLEVTDDDALVDLRQVRWRSGRSLVDLKYIPGVVAVVYSEAAR